MIPNVTKLEQSPWQLELLQAIHNPQHLLKLLNLETSELVSLIATQPRFNLLVPQTYVARMQRGDPHDPLLRQVLPLVAEQQVIPNFTTDPTGDLVAEKNPGILHKYQGRILLITTGACAIHCRYCFRQHYTYSSCQTLTNLTTALKFLAADTSITEIILSGGDPLCLTDKQLAELTKNLAKIPHLQRLRLHTRLPIIIPQRVNAELLHWLTATRLQPIVVVHANHANEINEPVKQALLRLVNAGITVLNQSVLLRGVNDNAQVLASLSETLFQSRVLPYYLHLLDRVQGAAHFEVAKTEACQLLEQLRTTLPGYLVPKMVRETKGMAYKQPL
jgi:EF-P beta-lysylation protein EpmB